MSEPKIKPILHSNGVILVEGIEGIGFSRFMKMLNGLKIKYFCVADNDALMEIPNPRMVWATVTIFHRSFPPWKKLESC